MPMYHTLSVFSSDSHRIRDCFSNTSLHLCHNATRIFYHQVWREGYRLRRRCSSPLVYYMMLKNSYTQWRSKCLDLSMTLGLPILTMLLCKWIAHLLSSDRCLPFYLRRLYSSRSSLYHHWGGGLQVEHKTIRPFNATFPNPYYSVPGYLHSSLLSWVLHNFYIAIN